MQRTFLFCACLFASAVITMSAQAPAGAAAAPTAATIANGKKLYLAKGCWTCHDYEAQGGNGPRLASTALPLKGFITYIRAPRGGMPPYLDKVISDPEVADLYAFVQSIPKPTPARNIPLLNP